MLVLFLYCFPAFDTCGATSLCFLPFPVNSTLPSVYPMVDGKGLLFTYSIKKKLFLNVAFVCLIIISWHGFLWVFQFRLTRFLQWRACESGRSSLLQHQCERQDIIGNLPSGNPSSARKHPFSSSPAPKCSFVWSIMPRVFNCTKWEKLEGPIYNQLEMVEI